MMNECDFAMIVGEYLNIGDVLKLRCVSRRMKDAIYKYLPCKHVEIKTVKQGLAIQKMSSSIRLSINNDGLKSTTSKELALLTNLESLNLQNNVTIEGWVLGQLTNLTSLNISKNKTIKDEDITHLINLTSLNLWYNDNITSKCVRLMTKLRSIDLSHNETIDNETLTRLYIYIIAIT